MLPFFSSLFTSSHEVFWMLYVILHQCMFATPILLFFHTFYSFDLVHWTLSFTHAKCKHIYNTFFSLTTPKGTLFLLGSHIGSQLLFVFLPFHHYIFMLYLHTLICYSTTFYLFWSSYEYSWMHYVILLFCIHYIFLLSCTDSSYYYAKNILMHWFALLLCLKHFNAPIRPTTMLKHFDAAFRPATMLKTF